MLDAILATIAEDTATSESLKGRTLLQKKLYFLSRLADEDFGFTPHFYGPYSSAVSRELGALISAGFVREETDTLPFRDGRFAEKKLYRYTVTDAFREIQHEYQAELDSYRHHLKRINRDPVARSIELISVAAKVDFILSQTEHTDIDDIRREAADLGWNLDQGKIERIATYLKSLGLTTEMPDE